MQAVAQFPHVCFESNGSSLSQAPKDPFLLWSFVIALKACRDGYALHQGHFYINKKTYYIYIYIYIYMLRTRVKMLKALWQRVKTTTLSFGYALVGFLGPCQKVHCAGVKSFLAEKKYFLSELNWSCSLRNAAQTRVRLIWSHCRPLCNEMQKPLVIMDTIKSPEQLRLLF